MQSVRRAALRSALSASRAVSSTTRSSPFAAQIARKTISPIARPSIISARFFSQTGRVANEEKAVEEAEVKPAEEAEVKPAEKDTEAIEAAEQPAEAAEGVQEFQPGEPTPYGVFIRNLVFDASEEHLAALFEKCGKVHLTKIARDAANMSKGYGFVWFTNAQDQQEAILAFNNTFWHGRRIFVNERTHTKPPTRRPRHEPSRSLYIGNIPYETTDSELNELFSSINGVLDVRVAVDRTTGWPRGFCHVDFKDVETATAAMRELNGRQVGPRELSVDYATTVDRRRGGSDDRRQDRRDESQGQERQF